MDAPPVSRIGWNDQKIMRTRRELNTVTDSERYSGKTGKNFGH